MKCRHCASALGASEVFVDLGAAPPSNAFLTAQDLQRPESHFPLKVYACGQCRLVQVDEVQRHDALFSDDYVYFSSYSASWMAHAKAYVDAVVPRLGLHAGSRVMEVASNDGYLLRHFAPHGVPCIGIEPTHSTAQAARALGVETVSEFFGRAFAAKYGAGRGKVDLWVGNNVLAHVPDINDFVAGIATVLKPSGCATFEFPQLLSLLLQRQYDTIYHEHFSYLSLLAVERVLATQGLAVWDVQTLPTHGGSLRLWVQHARHERPATLAVEAQRALERHHGLDGPVAYQGHQARAEALKDELLRYLLQEKQAGRRVAAYGAAAKGNTLLNFAGVRPDLLPYVVDASPHKQGRFLPGSRIPVLAPEYLMMDKPDRILILPWNLRDEIAEQLAAARDWGARFVVAVPGLQEF
jgi:SAM-dependent methyltransferase